MKSLRPQRARKFAARWVENGFNTTQAVIDCGITNNRNSAHVIGNRLLQNVITIKAVEDHIKSANMSAAEVLQRLTDIARTDTDFKGSDVVKAVELLGKGHKLFTDKVEHSGLFSEAFTKLKAEFADIPDDELKSWLADLVGVDVKQIGGIQ